MDMQSYNVYDGSMSRPRSFKVSPETLNKMFIEKNMTVADIAEELHVCGGSVEKRLKEFGIKRDVARNLIALPDDVLRKMYIEQKKTIAQIAIHFRCSKSAARDHLISAGILAPKAGKKFKRNLRPSRERLCEMLFDEEMTHTEIARQIGVCQVTVSNWVNFYDIKRAPLLVKVKLPLEDLRRMYVDEKQNMEMICKHFGCGESTVRNNIVFYGLGLDSGEVAARRLEENKKKSTYRYECQGYRFIKVDTHPKCNDEGYIGEHRYNVECAMGRYLVTGEHVHHINLQKLDNRVENLAVLFHGEHSRIHKYMERCMAYLAGLDGAIRPDYVNLGREVFWGGKYIRQIDLIGDKQPLSSRTFEDLFRAAVDAMPGKAETIN